MPTDTELILQELGEYRGMIESRVDHMATQEEVERLGDAIKAIQDEQRQLRLDRAARMDEGRLRVLDGRYAGLDFLGLKLCEEVLARRVNAGRSDMERLMDLRKARAELKNRITPDTLMRWEENLQGRIAKAFPDGQAYRARQDFAFKTAEWRQALMPFVLRAMDSTTAAIGDELVPTLEAAELWMDVNLETLILPLLPQTVMSSNPYDIPTQLGDTNWYPTTENVQTTTTDLATAKTTLTAYGLKTGVPFSDELEEDAIINTAAEIRANLVRNAAEVIDDVLLNADTTTTNGINSDGATIAASTAGKGQWLLGFDGLIHLALVDNSANQSFNHTGGAVSTAMYNQALRKIGKYASGRRPGEVVYVADVNTAIATLDITAIRTVDVAGARATLSTGEVAPIFGVPLIRSEQMLMADNDGKITDSGNSTSTGRVLCFNTSQWRVGFRRQIEVETEREAGKSQTTMYVSFRIALTERSGTRSSATHSSIAYNIGSVT